MSNRVVHSYLFFFSGEEGDNFTNRLVVAVCYGYGQRYWLWPRFFHPFHQFFCLPPCGFKTLLERPLAVFVGKHKLFLCGFFTFLEPQTIPCKTVCFYRVVLPFLIPPLILFLPIRGEKKSNKIFEPSAGWKAAFFFQVGKMFRPKTVKLLLPPLHLAVCGNHFADVGNMVCVALAVTVKRTLWGVANIRISPQPISALLATSLVS